MVFDAFRAAGGPTYYSSNKTAVTWDVLVAGFVFAFLVIAATFCALLPGFQSWQRVFTFTRISFSVFIGASIMVPNFGQSWEVSRISNVPTAYKAGRGGKIHADVGVKIGLRAVNITLKGIPEHQDSGSDSPAAGERVNYNERFYFEGDRAGTDLADMARLSPLADHQHPARNGRPQRRLVAALPHRLVPARRLYATIRYGSQLVIPFSSDHVLHFTYGWSFYLCLVGGLVAVTSSLVCLATLFFFPDETEVFFGVKEEPESMLEYYQRRAREAQAARAQWATVSDKVIAISRVNGNGSNVSYVPRQKNSRRRKLSDLVLAVREFGKEKVVSEEINSINIYT